MIKHFIFAKLAEKFFKKAMQGDRRGLMKYFKIALVAFIVFVVLVIIGIFFLLQFIFGLFVHVGNQAESVKNVNEIKIEESIKKAKEMVPEEEVDASPSLSSRHHPLLSHRSHSLSRSLPHSSTPGVFNTIPFHR